MEREKLSSLSDQRNKEGTDDEDGLKVLDSLPY